MTFEAYRLGSLLELLEYHAEPFCRLSSVLGQAIMIFKHGRPNSETLHGFAGSMGELERESVQLGLRSVAKQLGRLKDDLLGNGTVTEQAVTEVYNRLRDALEDRLFLAVPAEVSDYYRQPEPLFGKDVEDHFPSAIEDISEAGKCLALDRGTASVFHLMRAMECAVQSLASKLEIKNPDRVWGMLLSDIHGKIESMPKGDLRNQWSESHTHLYHVKQAWRNDTMHPKQTYTFSEAKAIFEAVKVFMNHLAPLVRP